MAENKFNFTFGFLRADNTKVYPSFEAFSGPYSSINEAHAEISGFFGDELPVGKEFYVVDADGVCHKYYYKTGNQLSDIAEIVSVVDTALNESSTNALSAGVASREFAKLKEEVEALRGQLIEQLKSV